MPDTENKNATSKTPVKVVSYFTDEWHNRIAILSDGRVFIARNRGQAGANYDKWRLWNLADEILKDIGE